MSLTQGTRIGAYAISGPLGAGGMGEVYRARDSKLDRDIALKILPPEFARDEERVARFRREAKTLASINHPHIAHIHGLEEASDGTLALVMELVEGEPRDGRVHGARAGEREDRRSPRRHLGIRVRALRDAHRPPRVRWRRHDRDSWIDRQD